MKNIVRFYIIVCNLQEHMEEEISSSNSDEEDNYGVDALELLLQKLKPKTVQDRTPPLPCPDRKWKIELPKLQDEEDTHPLTHEVSI